MSNLELFGVLFGSFLLIVLSLWAAYSIGSVEWKKEYDDERQISDRLRHVVDSRDAELRDMTEFFHKNVEIMVEEKMRAWSPDEHSIAGDFDQALRVTEYMRKNRETLDAGRRHPPRSDSGGEPAVIRSAFAPRRP